MLNDKILKVKEYERTLDDDIFDEYEYGDIKPIMTSDFLRDEDYIEQNQKICDTLRQVCIKEEKYYRLKSLRCEDLELFITTIEYNMLICDVLTKNEMKISLEKLETVKKSYEKVEQIHHYRSEMKSHIDKLIKEGKELK